MTATSSNNLPAHSPPVDTHLPNEGWERVMEAARNSRAHSTTVTYRKYLSDWAEHAKKRRVRVRPAHPAAVGEWLTTMADEGKSISTLQVARAALAAAHREAGLDDPTTSELVRRVLSGLAREAARQGKRPTQVKGLTAERLQTIVAHFDRTGGPPPPASIVRDLAMVRVMRDALLRRGEAAELVWGDISRARDRSGRLIIRFSKTDQEGRGSVMYLSRATMAALDRIRPADASAESSVFGITGPHLSTRISALAKKAGLGPGYSGHSCRIGMAQDLAAEGYSLAQLMTAGRWTNPAMPARYTRNQTAARNAVAQYYRQIRFDDTRLPPDVPPADQPPLSDDPSPRAPSPASTKKRAVSIREAS